MAKPNGFLVALAVLGCAVLAATAAAARQSPASIIVDANSGAILHGEAADASRYPASLTKIMTMYLVFERLEQGRLQMTTPIVFSATAARQPPSKLGLAPGATITVEQALKALITKSANDVATAVAEHLAGSEPAFARLMTARAKELGMHRTQFRNASGLPDSAQVTTARDMVTLGLALQDDFPARYRMFALQRFYYGGRRYTNNNRLLGRFRGTDGIKTGYTRASGFNITTSVRRDGRHLIGVVIGQSSGRARDAHMRKLLETAFDKATTVRSRRRGQRPLLIAQPRLVSKSDGQQVARPVVRQPVSAALPAAKPHVRSTTDQRTGADNARPPSTFGAQLAKLSAQISGQNPAPADRPPAQAASLRNGAASFQRPPESRASPAPALPGATHQVQIGAFFTEAEARRALAMVQDRAGSILRGYSPLLVRIEANQRKMIRVRFAGFDQSQADATCSQLKTVRVDCFVARNN